MEGMGMEKAPNLLNDDSCIQFYHFNDDDEYSLSLSYIKYDRSLS